MVAAPTPARRQKVPGRHTKEWVPMQSRSWMAASLAIAALGAFARADDPPVANTVKLELQIAGLGPEGCAIEVRPAHPACQFAEVVTHVPSSQAGSSRTVRLPALVIAAQSTGAD